MGTLLQIVATVATLVSLFMLGRTGATQRRGLWVSNAACVLWLACAAGLHSWPLAFQQVVIVGLNVFNLISAHRRANGPAHGPA
jgi:hypothetical protein